MFIIFNSVETQTETNVQNCILKIITVDEMGVDEMGSRQSGLYQMQLTHI